MRLQRTNLEDRDANIAAAYDERASSFLPSNENSSASSRYILFLREACLVNVEYTQRNVPVIKELVTYAKFHLECNAAAFNISMASFGICLNLPVLCLFSKLIAFKPW